MKNLLSKIKGWKKITAAILALLAAVLGPDVFNLDPIVIENIIQTLTFYLLGQGAADLGEHMSPNKADATPGD